MAVHCQSRTSCIAISCNSKPLQREQCMRAVRCQSGGSGSTRGPSAPCSVEHREGVKEAMTSLALHQFLQVVGEAVMVSGFSLGRFRCHLPSIGPKAQSPHHVGFRLYRALVGQRCRQSSEAKGGAPPYPGRGINRKLVKLP